MDVYAEYEADRDLILETLTRAGWKVTSGSPVDAADLAYTNGIYRLHLDHGRQERRWFNLTLTREEDRREATFLVEFGPFLEEVLRALVERQEELRPETFNDVLFGLYDAADELYAYRDAQPVPLPLLVTTSTRRSEIIASALERAGWQRSPGTSRLKADFLFRGGHAAVALIQSDPDDAPIEKRAAYVIVGKEPPKGAALLVYYGDALHRLLKVVIQHQDTLELDGIGPLALELARVFPKIYAILDREPRRFAPDLVAVLERQASS